METNNQNQFLGDVSANNVPNTVPMQPQPIVGGPQYPTYGAYQSSMQAVQHQNPTINENGLLQVAPAVFFGPQTHSAPVPVAIAPSFVQLAPIIAPITVVPNLGNEEDLLH